MPSFVAAFAATAMLAAPAHAQDPAPTITIGDAVATETDGPGTELSFPITADNFTGSITLAVATRAETALAPDDFASRLTVFTIPALVGPNTNYRFNVQLTGDQVFEPTETLKVAYRVIPPGEVPPVSGQPGVGATPDLASEPVAATGTILDDDTPASAPAAGPAPAPKPAPPAPAPVAAASKPSLTSVATLPSTKQCVSRRKFRIRLRSPKDGKIASATVKLRGKTVATRKGKRVTAPIDLRGLPKGTFTVSIRVVLTDGRVVTGSRTYRTCAPKQSAAQAPKV